MHRRSLWVLVAALAAGVALLGTSSAVAGPSVARGTVIFGADQEPAHLNTFLIGGNHFWGSQVVSPVMAGSMKVHPDFVFRPYLVSKVVVGKKPFSLTYFIKKNASWYQPGSKAVPITAADYVFTWRTIMNPNFRILSTTGYEDIARVQQFRDKKKVKFVFKRPYAGWRAMFGLILPAHALRGEDFNQVWINNLNNPKNGKPIASGAYYLRGWDRGKQATLEANPQFWGKKASIKTAIYRFLPNTNTTAEQIRGGEVDVIYPQPQPFLVPLRSQSNLRTQIGRGPVWEHVDFNLGHRGLGDPSLRKKFVRQAMMYGTNRAALVRALYTSTGIAPGLPVLNSLIFVTNSKYYKAHFAKYAFNATRARNLLQSNGCTRGGDGIYSCQGARLSFKYAWTAGNQLRQLTFEIMQAQLKNVGIELVADPTPANVIFATKRPSGNYDLILFAWVGSPDVSGWVDVYGCRVDTAGQEHAQDNDQGYCNRTVDRLLTRSNVEFNAAQQAKTINQAIAIMANDVPVMPLFQKPTYLIHKRVLRGLRENPTSEGPVWNLEQWTRTAG